MKYCITLLAFLLLIGCESESTYDNAEKTELNQQLVEAMNTIAQLEESNQLLIHQNIELRTLYNEEVQKLNRLEHFIDELTRLEEFDYEILSDKINRPPYDCVIYIANVPEELVEQEIYVIRSAIEFSGKEYTKVSLWKDRQTAVKYINGEYNADEGVLGWSGFDERFGFIDQSSMPPILRHSFSRDDGQMMEFGKYRIEY